jgi:hypothetical protein
LVSLVRLLISEGLADKNLLTAAPRRPDWRKLTARKRAVEMAAVIVSGRPQITLAEIAMELQRFRVLPPRGGREWAVSSVKALLDEGRAAGMLKVPSSSV